MARGKKPPGRHRTPRTDRLENERGRTGDQHEETVLRSSDTSDRTSKGGPTSSRGVQEEREKPTFWKQRLTGPTLASIATLALVATAASNATIVWNSVAWFAGWESKARQVCIVEELEHRLAAAHLPGNENARLNALDARSVAPLHPEFADYRSKALLKELEKFTTGSNRDAVQKFLETWPPSHVEQKHLDALADLLKTD